MQKKNNLFLTILLCAFVFNALPAKPEEEGKIKNSDNESEQKLAWIPFNWEGDNVSGKFFDKIAITIPVTIDNLPYKFNMQLDLGAVVTVIYGNSIKLYLEKVPELKNKIDPTLKFHIQGKQNNMFKGVDLKLGNISFGKRNIGYFKDYGDNIIEINTDSEKNIGTIAPDIFQDRILLIDYPNKRICVMDNLPKEYSNASFQPFKIKDGRIKIPLNINGKQEDLLFDTGSSLFALTTTEKNADKISNTTIVDSLKIPSWGEYTTVYGKKVNSEISFGNKKLENSIVYFDKVNKYDKFFEKENIWGITGNAYFLNNVVIIDYKNKRFGVK
jgi:hypothetical protein